MRRLLYSLAAFAGLVCGLAGCHHVAGVCDCELDEDPCHTRAPWFQVAPGPTTAPEQLQKLPNKTQLYAQVREPLKEPLRRNAGAAS